ncbi:MAG: TrkH family potassium uptake protein [Dethiosulfatibacter sp.]|nr:TrkH family potassium uptake protein [Dethiosulfatibacter sp.]
MRYGIVAKVLGSILVIESGLLAFPLFISVYYREASVNAFLITILLTGVSGFLLTQIKTSSKSIKAKEGIMIVTFGWILISVFGAMPLYMTGSVSTFVDALFETISGFTTTGASVILDVESLSKGILFWRSFTHWIGGMGILVFTLALLPTLGIGSMQIFKAETPGPFAGKMAPRMKDTARVLYITYLSLTLVEILFLLVGGVSLFDAALFTFGTVGTGGFAPYNDSLARFGSHIHIIVSIFMVFAGVNFSLHYLFYKGRFRVILHDSEFKLYIKFIVVAVLLIAVDLYVVEYDSFLYALRDSLFQTTSIMTTTGFSTVDFQLWPTFSKMILLGLMFVGGSAGSTAGGMKVIRVLIIFKLIKRELSKTFHSRALIPIKLGGKAISNESVAGVYSFLGLHILVFLVGTILVSLDRVDMITAISSSAATLNNIGPGFHLVGPTSTYGHFSDFSKLVFCVLMLLGRLELFTIIALFVPKSWTKES